jgi:hypothetical protein
LLQNKGKLAGVLDKNKIDIQHTLNIVDLKEQVKNLQQQNTSLEFDNFILKESEGYWKMEYQSLKRKYPPLLRSLQRRQLSIR